VAAFNFRLAAVLRWREHVKDGKRWELRALNETRRRMEAEIHALEQELRDAGEMLAGQEGQVFSPIDLRLLGEHAQLLAGRISEKRTALARFDAELIAKRIELVEAMRAVKSLEQLRKRRVEKFQREQAMEEQKFADEVAQRKFVTAASRKKSTKM
jgi:flagellar export protein FliJ